MFKMDKNIKDLILLFGGSFDPPHLGHKAMLEHVIRSLASKASILKVFIIPSNVQPLKEHELSSAPQRLAMCELQFASHKMDKDMLKGLELIVSDYEINKGGLSYTVDTLRHFKELYPNKSIYILMGEDSFLDIERWKSPKELFSLCKLVVLSRASLKEEKSPAYVGLFGYMEKIKKEYNADISILNDFKHPASSTILRQELSKGQKPNYIDDDVWEYIVNNNLYKVSDVL